MHFATILAAASGLAFFASAGSIHFVNQDNTDRTIWFTASEPYSTPKNLLVPGLGSANQTFELGWIGNFYSVSAGAANTTGMLGEVRFKGYDSFTYFDVSAIVSPNDWNGVKELYPPGTGAPVSGCQTFPCDNCYNAPDDVQTQATDSNALVCLLGNLQTSASRKRRATKFTRDYVSSL